MLKPEDFIESKAKEEDFDKFDTDEPKSKSPVSPRSPRSPEGPRSQPSEGPKSPLNKRYAQQEEEEYGNEEFENDVEARLIAAANEVFDEN